MGLNPRVGQVRICPKWRNRQQTPIDWDRHTGYPARLVAGKKQVQPGHIPRIAFDAQGCSVLAQLTNLLSHLALKGSKDVPRRNAICANAVTPVV